MAGKNRFRLIPMILCLITLTACQASASAKQLSATQEVLIPVSGEGQTPNPTAEMVPSPDSTAQNTPVLLASPTQQIEQEVSILFTGVIVPARCIHQELEERDDYFYPYKEIVDLLSEPDLTVGILNASLSYSTPKTYCEQTLHLIADPQNAAAFKQAGFDVINLAANHIKNCRQAGCGDTAFYETQQAINQAGLLSVGAGDNLEKAYQPLYLRMGGLTYAFVSMGHIEPASFAGEDNPGIAVMTEESITKYIGIAKQHADVVIFLPHWGPEDSPKPTHIQRNLAGVAVAAGADLVVGNHPHVIQGYEEMDGVMVFYGLGNFLFDQTWSLDHQQSIALIAKFVDGDFSGFDLIPLHVDGDGRIYQPDQSESMQILSDMENASP